MTELWNLYVDFTQLSRKLLNKAEELVVLNDPSLNDQALAYYKDANELMNFAEAAKAKFEQLYY